MAAIVRSISSRVTVSAGSSFSTFHCCDAGCATMPGSSKRSAEPLAGDVPAHAADHARQELPKERRRRGAELEADEEPRAVDRLHERMAIERHAEPAEELLTQSRGVRDEPVFLEDIERRHRHATADVPHALGRPPPGFAQMLVAIPDAQLADLRPSTNAAALA